MHKYKFTILTPVYNGEKTIHRVYDSLRSQTFSDFEWIVINDASTDRTDEIIKTYTQESYFQLRYLINKENKGMNYNYDLGISIAAGELFLVADADDEFLSNTLERLLKVWESYSKKEKISGISCNCQDQYANFIGKPFPESPWISNDFDMRFKHKIKGEKWNIKRTDIIKKYRFWNKNYKYVPSDIVWLSISASYESIFINDTLRVYFINETIAESMEAQQKENPAKWSDGIAYYYGFMLNKYSSLILKNSFIAHLKHFMHYIYYSYLAKIPLSKALNDLKGFQNKALFLLMLLPGYLYIFLKKSCLWENIKKIKTLCAA